MIEGAFLVLVRTGYTDFFDEETMKYGFKELVDIPKLQELTDELYRATSIPSSIITMEGEIVTGSGWQRICTEFHRRHPQIEKECIESDTTIRRRLDEGEPFAIYKCPRGLVDASSPIVIAGEHVANVFSGQVFLEPPDEEVEEFFREQARRFGFDEEEYIKAFKEVPVFTKEKFRAGISFLSRLAHIIADMGLMRLQELEAMERMRESEESLHSFLNAIPESAFMMELDGTVLALNRTTAERLGKTPEEVLGHNMYDFIPGDVGESRKSAIEKIKKIRKSVTLEDERFGRCLYNHISPILDAAGEVVRLAVVGIDITDKIEKERQLRETEKKYRDLVDLLPQPLFEIDLDANFTFANQFGLDFFGYTEEDIRKGLNAAHLFAVEDRERLKKNIKRVLEGEALKGTEYSVFRKDGSKVSVLVYSSPIMHGNKTVGLRGVLVDITDRKKTEEALRESEERYRILSEESPVGIAFIDEKGRYQYVNPKFTEIFGYTLEDIPTGREWFRKAYPEKESRQEVISTWKGDMKEYGVGESRPRTYKVTCKNGKQKTIHFKPLTMKSGNQLVLCEDVTEKHRMEAQLQQAQRMESIGTLAGGIAHDFNNLLMSIQGNTSLMLLDKEPHNPDYESLRNIEQCVQEGAGLTRQLLGFARGGKYQISSTDLNELLKTQNRVFGHTKKEIKIHGQYDQDLRPVEVDRNQIQQVLMNLYVNASQAMPGGGDLYTETQNVVLDEGHVRPFGVPPGRYVKISVTDTGTGMDERTKERIFEPFFTTKEMGRGTGLGLASVYGIVKNHGGFINVFSEKGKGSTFHIYLPAAEGEAKEGQEEGDEGLKYGDETVLLVDDEDRVIHVGRRLLERLGYRPMTAKNGEEAVALYEKNRDGIDLVLLDMIMPGMSGGETFDRLKELDPDVKVLLSSGYSIDGEAREILDRGCRGFIQKPFNMTEISQKIRRTLDATG